MGQNGSKWVKKMVDIGHNGFKIGSVFGDVQAYAGVLFHLISSFRPELRGWPQK